jgi:hypothetical protein
MAKEDADQLGIDATHEYEQDAIDFFNQRLWFFYNSPTQTVETLLEITQTDANRVAAREAKMIADISRISANALAKLVGEVEIAVCFGSAHYPVAEYFISKGLEARLSFIDPATKKPVSTHIDDAYNQAIVKRSPEDVVSEESCRAIAISALMEPAVAARLRKTDRRFNPRVHHHKIKEVLNEAGGTDSDEIWDAWEQVHLPGLTMDEKAGAVKELQDTIDPAVDRLFKKRS